MSLRNGSKVISALWQAEVAAARIEGMLSIDPGLANLWRTEAAVAEAVSSVALEDARISAKDFIRRLTMNGVADSEDRAVLTGLSVLRFLKRPGDIIDRPIETIRRIEASTGWAEEDEAERDEEEMRVVGEAAKWGSSYLQAPITGGIRAALVYGHLTNHECPARERLVFTAAESRLRTIGRVKQSSSSVSGRNDELDENPFTETQMKADWIAAPSTALTREGFKIWSITSGQGLMTLCTAFARSMSWEMGQIGVLRHYLEQLRSVGSGRRGRSRHDDMARWIITQPVFSSGQVMREIGVTRSTALSLIEEFEAEGLITCLTPRKRFRFWATKSLGTRLALSESNANARKKRLTVQAEDQANEILHASSGSSVTSAEMERESGWLTRTTGELDETLRALDEIVKEVDAVLSGFKLRMAARGE